MPIYEYQCEQCGKIEEVIQKFSDAPLTTCPNCSGKLRKLISHSAFHLKGTGWYVTDYAGKTPKNNSDSAAETKAGASDSKSTDKSVKSDSD